MLLVFLFKSVLLPGFTKKFDQGSTTFVFPPFLLPKGVEDRQKLHYSFWTLLIVEFTHFFFTKNAFFDAKSNESDLLYCGEKFATTFKELLLGIVNNFSGLFRREETTFYLWVNIFIYGHKEMKLYTLLICEFTNKVELSNTG